MKTYKIQTWLPMFPGFYGTIFEKKIKENFIEDNEIAAYHITDYVANRLRKFVHEIIFEQVSSPREYNFRNDIIDVEIILTNTNITSIKNIVNKFKDKWSIYLKNNYTSCDGFISNYSNAPNSSDWDIENILNDSHILGAILDFILTTTNASLKAMYRHKSKSKQLLLQKELQALGYNIVTCPNCGQVIITKNQRIIICDFCKTSGNTNIFGDLNY